MTKSKYYVTKSSSDRWYPITAKTLRGAKRVATRDWCNGFTDDNIVVGERVEMEDWKSWFVVPLAHKQRDDKNWSSYD